MKVIGSRATDSEKLLFSTWMIASMILSTAYCTFFFALVTVPEFEKAIDTREDLMKIAISDSHFLLTRGHTSFQSMFLYAKPRATFFYEIGRHMNR